MNNGDISWGKPEDTICIVLQNVDGIPTNISDKVKLDCLQQFVDEYQMDIYLPQLNSIQCGISYLIPANYRQKQKASGKCVTRASWHITNMIR